MLLSVSTSVNHKRLYRQLKETCVSWELLQPGDRIMVALSGGKDSYTMLHLLGQLQPRLPFEIELIAVHLDQVQPGYDGSSLIGWLEESGYRYEILREDTYSVVIDKVDAKSTYCALCSRLRRGILYTAAERLGCNKIALGHHRDDSLETLLINLFYAGKLQAMPAVYTTDDGRFQVIRPLIECEESRIAALAEELAFPILPCNLCGSQEGLKREATKALLAQLEATKPDIKSVMMRALGNVRPTHLLDKDVLAAWEKRPDDVRREGDLKPGPKRSAAEPVKRGGPRLPVIS